MIENKSFQEPFEGISMHNKQIHNVCDDHSHPEKSLVLAAFDLGPEGPTSRIVERGRSCFVP